MYTTRFDAVNKLWSGPKNSFQIDRHKNFGEIILEKLADNPERVMQIDGDTGESLTKTETRARTIRCAQNLMNLGCTQCDCIGVVARNHQNLTPLIYAALCIGAPISPLDVVIVKDGISTILQRVRPTFIFCDADVLETIRDINNDIGLNAKLFTVNGSADGFDSIDNLMKATGIEDSFACAKIDDAFTHVAVIACSSGSTGLPKSICMSHAMFDYSFSYRIDELACINLCFSSLYWFTGVWTTISSAYKNTRVFTTKSFTTDFFFDLVAKQKIELFLGPPCQLQAFLKSERCASADLSSLKACFVIGGSIPSVLIHTMKQFIPKCVLLTTYGTTEIGGSVSCTVPKELEEYPNSGGQLVPGVKVKIISETTGERCGIGEEGEIYIKAPVPSIGYYKDETATRNSFDVEGYFISGDIGYFSKFGRLFINGRKKEIFKNCGFAIWPMELEDLILKNSAISDASVVSVYDSELLSDLPAAVVVKTNEYSITEDQVYAIIADQLASYKRLDGGIYFVDKLPMTPSDKIIRSKVKVMAQKFYESKKQKQNAAK